MHKQMQVLVCRCVCDQERDGKKSTWQENNKIYQRTKTMHGIENMEFITRRRNGMQNVCAHMGVCVCEVTTFAKRVNFKQTVHNPETPCSTPQRLEKRVRYKPKIKSFYQKIRNLYL